MHNATFGIISARTSVYPRCLESVFNRILRKMIVQKENDAGYIVYVDNKTEEEFTMDPNLQDILEQISIDYNHIKYPTYRVSSKLIALSKALNTHYIPYQSVTVIMERHRLHQTDNAPVIRPTQLTALLHDIFYASDKMGLLQRQDNFDVDRAAHQLANLLWNIFDADRTTPLSLLELRQTFLFLCQTSSYEQIIYEHFVLASDHNRCVSRYRFEEMVKVMSKVLAFLEGTSEPQLYYASEMLQEVVLESFAQCPGIVGLNEFQFYDLWRLQKTERSDRTKFTHFANVHALLKRLNDAAEVIHHNTQCVSCDTMPIHGLRFKCTNCHRFSLCFGCFSTGFISRKHDRSHRMYEISKYKITPNRLRSFLNKLCNLFTRPEDTADRDYEMTMETNLIEIESNEIDDHAYFELVSSDIENQFGSTNHQQSQCHLPSLSLDGNRQTSKLSSILEVLMDANTRFSSWMQQQQQQIHKKDTQMTEMYGEDVTKTMSRHAFLQHHQNTLTVVIGQLRELSMHSDSPISSILPHSSTPYRQSSTTSSSTDAYRSLATSIKGTEVNKSYLEANKTDLSLNDISTWLHTRNMIDSSRNKRESLPTVPERDTSGDMGMLNFKNLLHIVKEIIDDSYSDNTELSKATSQLEKVLEDMIGEEERKRIL